MCVTINGVFTNSRYRFFAKVFNWPNRWTISEYNLIGGNEPDGVMYGVLGRIKDNTENLRIIGVTSIR